MFYSHVLFTKDGPLARVWLAAHVLRRLKDRDIREMDIPLTVDKLQAPRAPMALRLCGQLLYGLVRIYNKKVELAQKDAANILDKIKRLLPREGEAGPHGTPRKQRGGGAAAAGHRALELDPSELRGGNRINLPDIAPLDDDLGFGLDNNEGLDLDNLALLDGRELDLDTASKMPPPHITLNLEDGSMSVSTPLFGANNEVGLMEEDRAMSLMDEEPPLDLGEGDVLDMDMDMGLGLDVSEGRRAATALQDESSMGLGGRESLLQDKSALLGADGDEGGLLLGMDDDLQPGAGGVSALQDPGALSDLLEKSHAELRALKQAEAAKKRAARKARDDATTSRRRGGGARARAMVELPYREIDEQTYIHQRVFRQWIEDASDLLRNRLQLPLKDARTLQENWQELDRMYEVEDQRDEVEIDYEQADIDLSLHLPSSGLGHLEYRGLDQPLRTNLSMVDMGCWSMDLRRMIQARMNARPTIDGMRYKSVQQMEAESVPQTPISVAASVPGAGAGVSAADQTGGGGLGEIGLDAEMDFGLAHEDAFPAELPLDEEQKAEADAAAISRAEQEEAAARAEEEEAAAAAREAEEAEGIFDGASFPPMDDTAFSSASLFGGSDELDPHQRALQVEREDVAKWWGERGGSLRASEKGMEEHVESGWSRRTKRMHTILAQEFKKLQLAQGSKVSNRGEKKAAATTLSFDNLVEGHTKAVAAGSFYQLLVLSSGGFLHPIQAAPFGDIELEKTSTFDSRRLPRVPESMSQDDSQQTSASPAF